MSYFTEIPVVLYPSLTDAAGENTSLFLTNILARSAFLSEVISNVSLFYDYQVKDGETAEIIADKLYGDVNRAWIVLLFNQLHNPFYDFPLVIEQLHDLITTKYSQSLEDSQTTIHHYEAKIDRVIYLNGMPESSSQEIVIISQQQQNRNTGLAEDRIALPNVADTSLSGDSTTINFGSGVTVTTEYTYTAVSNYTYEVNENEKRRSIKLLDVSYIGNVESEFRRLMRDGN
jgi:hypothetical protein